MTRYIATIFLLYITNSNAQVAIGKSIPSVTNSSVSIEFGDAVTGINTGKKGLVLPRITNSLDIFNTTLAGTIIFDTHSQKVLFSKSTTVDYAATNEWVDLTLTAEPSIVKVKSRDLQLFSENQNAKVFVGKNPESDTTKGILVLGDKDKAMILPRVSSYKNIVNPSAGMMVYVTTNKQFAVYNGREWTFWDVK